MTGTQAIDRAAELLKLIVTSDRPRTFTSLFEETDLARSTTSRLLQALERHRLVRRDHDGAFRAGPLFAQYAARNHAIDGLVELSRLCLERLGEATGEVVNLAVPRGDTVVQLAQVDSVYLLGMKNWVGIDVPAHCTAAGKVFLAHGVIPLPSGRLTRRAPQTITDRSDLERDLAQVIRKGFAITREELEPGLTAIAAPVRTPDGSIVASVSVSGPTTRIDGHIERIGELLVQELKALSGRLGHQLRKEDVA